MGIFTGKVQLADGWVCVDCYKKTGRSSWNVSEMGAAAQITSVDMRRMIQGLHPLSEEDKKLEPIRAANLKKLTTFIPTVSIDGIVGFDDRNMEFYCRDGELVDFFSYQHLVDFELLQNGGSISKGGIGKALIGGILFGTTGAVVGAASTTRSSVDTCDSLCIKVTLRNTYKPVAYIYFITQKTSVESEIYKTSYLNAHKCMSLLTLACEKNKKIKDESHSTSSQLDELRVLKQLLDEGIITNEEFLLKKTKILGI